MFFLNKPNKKNKSFQVSKPVQNITVSGSWTIIVLILSFILSIAFSIITSGIKNLHISLALLILSLIILLNVVFDMLGTAVAAAEEFPFHSLASRKVVGASHSVKIIRHAPQVSNVCNDVIGDIAGIISGTSTAIIVTQIILISGLNMVLVSLLLTAIVSSLTIGGKAMVKGISMKNCNSIVFFMGKCYYYFDKMTSIFHKRKKRL